MTRAAALVAVLLVGACGSERAADGPLASGVPTRVAIGVATAGEAVWASVVVVNRGAEPLVIVAVEPLEIAAGLAVTGVRVRVLGVDGDATGDPNPSVSGSGQLPAATAGLPSPGSVELAPYDETSERPQAELLVGLTPAAPGRYEVRGLRIRYRAGADDRTGEVTHTVVVCAADVGDPPAGCDP